MLCSAYVSGCAVRQKIAMSFEFNWSMHVLRRPVELKTKSRLWWTTGQNLKYSIPLRLRYNFTSVFDTDFVLNKITREVNGSDRAPKNLR